MLDASPQGRLRLAFSTLATGAAVALAPTIAHADDASATQPDNAKPAAEAPEVRSNITVEGKAEDGYRAQTGNMGPLGDRPLQDTPYSINVAPQELIKNLQAQSPSDAVKYNPTVHATLGSNLNSNYYMIRGFAVTPFGTTSNVALDGMRASVLGEPIEDKEAVEVLNGPAGFLYGFAAPGGLVNYILKRPTATRYADITFGDYGGAQAFVHGDFGGPIDSEGKFGYRLNVLGVDKGNVGIDGETHKRWMASGALDWHLTRDTLLQVDASRFSRDIHGQQIIFVNDNVTVMPGAPDNSKNYGTSYGFTKDDLTRASVNLVSYVTDAVTIRAAARHTLMENSSFSPRGTWIDNSYNYTWLWQAKGTNKIGTDQGYAFVDWKPVTGPIKHGITAGVSQSYAEQKTIYPNGNINYNFPGTFVSNMSSPTYPPDPNYPLPLGGPLRTTEKTTVQTVALADQMEYGPWQLLAGGNSAYFHDRTWNANTGAFAAEYEKRKVTPTAAILFKPVAYVTLYTSYIEALQAGPTAPSTAANANAVLAPFLSRQVEAGAKSSAGNMDVNLAVFRIEKANAYMDPISKVYSEDGQEVHKGAEIVFTGKLTHDLTAIGGYTWLAAKITKTSTPSLQDKWPLGVPQSMSTLYLEYALPFVPGLVLDGGLNYTSKEYVNPANTLTIPSVAIFNVGTRYATRLWSYSTIFRLDVNNIAGKNYWTNKGDDLIYPGNPRILAFSVEVAL